jgi:3alpha(or 20beta)-hydroxysteroid dehydrogenase
MVSITSNWNALLADKVVFLNGAAGSIARYIARACYVQGARLVLGDLDPEAINKVKDEILEKENKKEDRILVVKLDVGDETSVKQAVQATLDKWKTIHILLNTWVFFKRIISNNRSFFSAATYVLGNVEEVAAEEWTRVFDINVRGYALMVKHIAPILKKQNGGSVVNMASVSGLTASPNWVPYSARKGAILQLTRNLALDLGSFNIRVNSVSPSGVNTPVTFAIGESRGISRKELEEGLKGGCLKRLCEPEEIANLFVFLVSDLCPFMTGANLALDGGTTIV